MVPDEFVVHECPNGRGLLWEVFREEGFGQVAVRTVDPGEIAGGHKHPLTNEWWLIFKGTAMVYLEYPTGGIRIREMVYVDTSERPCLIMLPAGTGHDIHNIGEGPVAFFFFADRVYDPETHDKESWSWHELYREGGIDDANRECTDGGGGTDSLPRPR